MSNELNLKGHFEPIHAAHAIEQVAFVLQMDRQIGDTLLNQAREIAKQFKNESDMPAQLEQSLIAFSFGVQPSVSPPSPPFILQRVAADGTPEKELKIDSNSITYKTFRYTRWNDAWLQARKYFDAITPIYTANAKIVGMGLNYIDKFKWVGNIHECKTNLLLQPSSKYLCPHIFGADDFWHSHTGVFIREDQATKRLLNVNVDYLDEMYPDDVRRVVTITTVLTDLMNQPGYESTEVNADDALKLLDDHMQKLHKYGKDVFGNIINKDMCRRIALNQD